MVALHGDFEATRCHIVDDGRRESRHRGLVGALVAGRVKLTVFIDGIGG